MQEKLVLRCAEIPRDALVKICQKYRLTLNWVDGGKLIPGSFWGESEAGLVGHALFVRNDTPVHSALHELGHFVCMDSMRRNALHTNAEGDYDEENGVCYLQILLSDYIDQMKRSRMFKDMDSWGYSFRLGSARKWFEEDAEDAKAWLVSRGVINSNESITWNKCC